jgi:hypothetical protein
MRAYGEQDFDKMAERIVDRFMGGAKLADAAMGEAMQGQLNPDQIARLVQAANTMAFLRLMEQQKSQGVPDMTHEFDPIDPREVMQQMVHSVDVPHMDAPQPHAEPDGDEGPLPDEMHHGPGGGDDQEVHVHGDESEVHVHGDEDDNDGPFPKGKKQKEKEKADKKDGPKKDGPKEPKKDEAKEAAFRERRLRKFAEVLEDQYRQAEWAFEDAFANLQRQLNRAHGAPTMEAFEKDALALHGDEIGVAMLNMVRLERGMPALEYDAALTKTAALADRHLVEETDVTRLFDQIVKIATEASKLQRGAAHVRSLCS